jgi:hypothetical protein
MGIFSERKCVEFVELYTHYEHAVLKECIDTFELLYDAKYSSDEHVSFMGEMSDAAHEEIRRLAGIGPIVCDAGRRARDQTNMELRLIRKELPPTHISLAQNTKMIQHKAAFYFQAQYPDFHSHMLEGVSIHKIASSCSS